MKLTNKQIQDKITDLAKNGEDIAINFTGSPARGEITKKDGTVLSERMNATDLHLWVSGFMAGVEAQSTNPLSEVKDSDFDAR